MKIKKNIRIMIVLILIAVLSMVGCSEKTSNNMDSSKNTTQAPESLVICSGSSAGTYYYIAAGQSKILSSKMNNIKFTTEATSGSPVENLSFTAQSVETLGIATVDGLYAAITGNKERGFPKKLDNIGAIQGGHKLILYGVTLQNSGINSISDLKGKRISVPTVGNTAYFQTVAILEQYGISLDDVKATPMTYGEAANALKDNTLDAIFVAGGIPQAAVTELDTTKDIKLLNIEEDRVKPILEKYKYWDVMTIPANTYSDQKEPLNVMIAKVMLVANLDLDEDTVYQITKVLNESVDELTAVHQNGADWNIETTRKIIDANIVPFHPGAMKYYNEMAK